VLDSLLSKHSDKLTLNILKLSIIIPCFNCEDTLQEAFESAYKQGLEDFEVVMVDDASTDGTKVLMEKLSAEKPNVKLAHHDKNKGGGATRNTAAKASTGDAIFCLDSDDILPNGTLKKMLAFMEEKRADGVGIERSIKFRGKDKKDVATVHHFGYVGEKIPFESLLEAGNIYCPLYSTFLITHKAFDAIGGYPEDHGFDTQGLAWRFLAGGFTACTCPGAEYLHRIEYKESYYLREANAGKVNYNWQDIFLEHLYLFDTESQEFIRSFDCKDFSKNIFDELRKRDRIFKDGYQDLLGTSRGQTVQLRDERVYIRRNSLAGMRLRLQNRLKNDARLKIISDKWKNGPALFVYWVLLRLRKLLKTDFNDICGHTDPIDVVIPTISKDYSLLSEAVTSVRKNLCHPINNIYIISKQEKSITDFCAEHNCQFIDELAVLGYGKEAIRYTVNGADRRGWLFQQLLKLSAGLFTSADNYLVVDSDTILIAKHSFIENGKFIFLQNEEWHPPYFKAFKKLFGYKVRTKLSYTSHMMIFNKKKLVEMKEELSNKHRMSWDQAYISTITIDEHEASCVSDYDTYANWMLYNYPKLIRNRPLYNKSLPRSKFGILSNLQAQYADKYKSLSFHSYINDHV
jgi:glycosyltransferase involved in cell wall biosynthesis